MRHDEKKVRPARRRESLRDLERGARVEVGQLALHADELRDAGRAEGELLARGWERDVNRYEVLVFRAARA